MERSASVGRPMKHPWHGIYISELLDGEVIIEKYSSLTFKLRK